MGEYAPNARHAATWRRYLRFWGPRAAADVDDELRFHIEMRVHDYMARGLSEVDAREATARRLGDLATSRAECLTITTRRERRMTRAQLLDAFGQDVSFAIRTLGRQKAWTAVAILTLALGIGANTAVFSIVNSLLLHPLPYPNSDRVAILFQEPTQGNQTGVNIMVTPRPALLRAWRESSRSFEDIEGYATRYGGDAGVIGRPLSLDGALYTVIGVMPAAFTLPPLFQRATDVWLPLDMHNDNIGLSAMARLRRGVTYAAAQRELDSVTRRLDVA